ncbi:hypothetical protein BSKO_03073 [Bryopsis sp. KO-2023]|nr:hypothetical protein BSKO_03073 [Bryopsis sp. KO-2023]
MQPNMYAPQAQRTWHQHFCCWCGDCDAQGWGSCCLSVFLPFIPFGWNRQRAFAKHGLLWGLAFFVLWLANILVQSLAREEHCEWDDDFNRDCESRPTVVGGILIAAFGIGLIALGYKNRLDLRARFGIEGNPSYPVTDLLLWICCSTCALCQETRTMMHNQVENGLWAGPAGMAQVVVTGKPAPGQGGSQYPPAQPSFEAPALVVAQQNLDGTSEYDRKLAV